MSRATEERTKGRSSHGCQINTHTAETPLTQVQVQDTPSGRGGGLVRFRHDGRWRLWREGLRAAG